MTNTRIDAPKMFREMHDIEIENVEINDADEVFWRCRNLNIKNLKLHGGTYPFMFSSNIRIDGLESDRILFPGHPGFYGVLPPDGNRTDSPGPCYILLASVRLWFR